MNFKKKKRKNSLFGALAVLALSFGGIGGSLLTQQTDTTILPQSITAVAEEGLGNAATYLTKTTPVETWDISATSSDSVTAYLYNDLEREGYYTLSIEGTGEMMRWTGNGTVAWKSYRANITSIQIADGITYIGDYAFYECKSLLEMDIPNSVTTIGQYAFSGCTGLKTLVIGEGVTSMGRTPFNNCTALTKINFNAIAMSDYVLNYYYYPFKNPGTEGEGVEVIIGKNVQAIPSCMFYGDRTANFRSLKFEEGSVCKRIGAFAFYECRELLKIEIGENVKTIEEEAFYRSYKLEKVYLNAKSLNNITDAYNSIFYEAGKDGAGIQVIVGSKVENIPDRLFYPSTISGDSSLPKIVSLEFEENSVCERIGAYAFFKAYGLVTVNIPESVAVIGREAFANCTNLTKINIPQALKTLEHGIFYNCSALQELYYNANSIEDLTSSSNNKLSNIGGNGSGIKVVIGKNVAKIPAYLFSSISKITSVDFEEGGVCTSIGDGAFSNCKGLTTITLFETVENIGERAFEGCTGVETVVLPEALTAIFDYTFYNCSKLGSIDIPESVTSIGASAFSNTSLKTVTIGESVKTLGGSAFSNNALEKIYLNAVELEDLTLTSTPFGTSALNDNGIEVTIGAKVRKIPSYLFNQCARLTSVTFEKDSVCESIGYNAFRYCTGLTAIALPESIKNIGGSSFSYCTSLTELELPQGLIKIESYAFNSCSGLATLTIPESLEEIEGSVFAGCTALNKIYFNALCLQDGSTGTLISGATNGIDVVIGANVTKIPAYLFSGNNKIKSVQFEEESACESIGDYAFASCAFTSITIPEKVTTIGQYAFQQCSNLTEINIPEKVTHIGLEAFKGCGQLEAVHITEVGCWAGISFEGDYANPLCLAENLYVNGELIAGDIVISEGITKIGDCAFYNCYNITSITLPESIETIGNSAFYKCSKLSTINIPSSVTAIFSRAFYYCSALKGVYITDVGAWASIDFKDYYANPLYYAKKLYVNGELIAGDVVIPAGVTSIGMYAFYYCSNITSVTLPEGLLEIRANAFDCCQKLKTINIPDTLTTIEYGAFANCSALSFHQYDNAYYLGNARNPYLVLAKAVNQNIEECEIHTTAKIILNGAFSYTKLKQITIPENIREIGNSAFNYCTELIEIRFNATNVDDLTNSNSVFSNAGKNTAGITLIIGANVTKIPAWLFSASNVNSIDFEQNSVCESIGAGAFSGLKNISNINLPQMIKMIGNSAFSHCSGLTSLELPQSLTSIGNNAFYGCVGLKSVTIPVGVTFVDNYAFSNCTGLESISIPETLTSIGGGVFKNCTGLTEIYYNAAEMEFTGSIYANNEIFYNAGKNGAGIRVTIGTSVVKIPDSLFNPHTSYPAKLVSVQFEDGSVCESIGKNAFYACSELKEINLPESIMSIDGNAFYNCTSLTSVVIPKSLKSMAANAFSNCTALTEIYFNVVAMESVSTYGTTYFLNAGNNGEGISVIIDKEVTCIPNYLFSEAKKLVSVQFEEGSVCESIGTNAFYACNELKEINLPKSLITIGPSAFSGCTSLTSIVIPEGVTSIDYNAFYNCTNLTSIELPQVLTIMGSQVFYNCTSLTSIVIPEGITTIGKNAFANCKNLTEIYFNAVEMEDIPDDLIAGELFQNVGQNVESINVFIGKKVTKIPKKLFNKATKITNVVFEEGSVCESIGYLSFNNCTRLKSIDIPANMKTIENSAFQSCSNLYLVKVESPTIALALTSSNVCGNLTYYAKTIAVAANISNVASFVTANFASVEQFNSINSNGSVVSYNVYSKHSHAEDASTWLTTDNANILTCSTCGISKYLVHTHQWNPWTIGNAPTETDSGLAQRVCALDSTHVETFEIPALNSEGYVYTAPTCTVNGGYRFENVEKDFVYEVVEKATGHTCESVVTPPTCTAQGYTTYTCHCGYSYQADYTEIIEHSYGEWETVVLPTCEGMGQDRRVCVDCSHFETRDVKANGHTEETLVGVEPTCYQTGLTEGKRCSVCETILVGQQVLPIVHKFAEVEKIDATCEADGYTLMRCACGAEEKCNIVYALAHNMMAWTTQKEASCEAYGEEGRYCLNDSCDYAEIRQTDKLSHAYIALGDGVFECQNGCKDRYEVTTGGSVANTKQKPIYDCPVDFEFTVYYAGTQADLAQNIIITQDFNYGSGINKEFTVVSGTKSNEWNILPVEEYKQGATYVVTLLNGAELCGQYRNTALKGSKLEFTIEIAENKADIEFNKGVKLVSLSSLSDCVEPTYNNEGYAYISLSSIDGLSVGDIICLSDASSLFDLINVSDYDMAADSFIGKIVEIYKNSNGTYQVKLQIPENIGDVFSKYDTSIDLKLDTSAISSEELLKLESSVGTKITEDLQSNKEFAEYLAAIGGSVDNYIAKYLADKGVSLKDAAGSEVLNFKFKIKRIDNGFIVTVVINTKFPMKNDDGTDYGTINVSLSLDNTVTLKAQNVGTKENGFLYFNIRLVQENICKTSFKVSYDYQYEMDEKPFARKSAAGMIHRSTCRYVSFMKEPEYLDSCPAGVIYCSVCKPQEQKNPDQILEEELKENLAYSDWGDLLDKVQSGKNNSNSSLNKTIKSIVKKAGLTTSSANNKGMPLGSYTAVFGCFTAKFELWFVFDFNINASLNYEYESKTTKIYGVKNDRSGVVAYQKDGDDDYVSTDLRLMGSIDVSAGFKGSVDVGFLDFIALGIEAEVGVYKEIAGVVGVTTQTNQGGSTESGAEVGDVEDVFADETSGYAALFYEMGVYYSGKIYGRISIFRINLLGGTRHDVPLYKLGYEKVYYSFAEPSDTVTLEVGNTIPTRPNFIYLGNYSLDVKYLNLNSASNKDLDMSTQSGKLALDVYAEHYDLQFSLEENDYCYLFDGGLQLYNSVLENAELKSFTVKLTLSVIGTDDWKKFKKDYENSVYYLEQDYVVSLNVTVHDWEETKYIEPNCHTQQYTRYDCRDCDAYHEIWGFVDSSKHTAKVTVDAKEPSCYQVGWETYEKCSDCGYSTYEAIEPTGNHVFNAYTIVKEPTCTGYGKKVQYCQTAGCRETGHEYSTFPLGHDLKEMVLTQATCTTPGIKGDKCTRCSYVENETVYDDPNGHQLKSFDGKEPTCTQSGWYSYAVCQLCDYNTKVVRPALGHKKVNHDGKAATCTTSGYEPYVTCERCDYTTYKTINPLGHILTTHAGVAPTCTENGYKAFVECTRTGCDYDTFEKILALGHSMVIIDQCEPTCTGIGYTDKQCTRCKIIELGEEVPALGHLMEEREAQAPTCVDNGWSEYLACTRVGCTHKEGYQIIPKTGVHTWSEVLIDSPSNTAIGWKYKCCTVCDDRENLAEIPRLPYSDGLLYKLTTDRKSYRVVGVEQEYLCDMVLRVTPEYGGLPVTEIGRSALQNCDSITKVILPNSVVSIEDTAFLSCDVLEDVQLGNNVTSIGSSAFAYCRNLNHIDLPSGIKQIASTAFTDTGYYLNRNNWENGVLYIGEYLINGNNSNFGKVPADYMIKAGTTCIAETAFSNSKTLESITVPDTLTYVGWYAFSECINLNAVHVNDLDAWCRITFETQQSNPLHIAHNLYQDGKAVTSVTIPEDITSINDNIFYGCHTLEVIVIPQTVTKIGAYAFYDCQNVRELTIPFVGLSMETDKWGNQLSYVFSGFGGTVIPSTLRKVTITGNAPVVENAFRYCYSVTEIEILADVERIGFGAFADCISLTKLTLPYVGEQKDGMQNNHFGYIFGLENSDDHGAISEALKEVVLTKAAQIDAYAFSGCKYIQSVSVNDTCMYIGEWAFSGCISITKIAIGEGVERIGNGAFSNLSSLETIMYNAKNLLECPVVEGGNMGASLLETNQRNGMVYIPTYEAFYQSGVAGVRVIVGESVENIPDELFYGLKIEKVYIQSASVVEKLVSQASQGGLIENAETIGVRGDINYISEYIALHYARTGTKEIDGVVYTLYTEHEHDLVNVPMKEPTCTEDGWSAHVKCNLCNYTSGKGIIVSSGHKPEWTVRQEADCKTEGLRVYHCFVCGEIFESEVLEKIPHHYSEWTQLKPPTSQHEGEEYRVCEACGDIEKKVIAPLGTVLDTEINFGHSCSFHNNLTMNYYVPVEDLTKYTSFYLSVEKDVYEDGVWSVKTTILQGELTSSGYKFVFKGIGAAEAGNELRAVLYAQGGDISYKSEMDVYSVKAYAYSRLEKSNDEEFKTLLVDMLNYCSSAQEYFGVNTENLVNADLTEGQKLLATKADVAVEDNSSTTKLDGATAKIVGKSILFNSNIEVKFYMDLSAYQDLTGLSMRVTYADEKCVVHSTKISSKDFTFDSSVGYYSAKLNNLNSAELRAMLTAEIYFNETVISDTIYYSVETYVYNRLNKSTNEMFKTLLKELMKYSDSAKKYFY